MPGLPPGALRRFRDGDEELFRRLVETHSPALLGVCRSFARDDDAAHDLLQETWVRAWSKRATYRGGSLAGWLFAICRRVCLSAERSRRAARETRLDEVPEPAGGDDVERAERTGRCRAAIARALLELPARQRQVVICRLIEGRSTRETARQMACAEGTVKATLHQALSRLARPLAAMRHELDEGDSR